FVGLRSRVAVTQVIFRALSTRGRTGRRWSQGRRRSEGQEVCASTWCAHQLDDSGRGSRFGEIERGLAAVVRDARIRTGLDQEADDRFGAAAGEGGMQRRVAIRVLPVDIEAEVEQQAERLDRFVVAALVERRREGAAVTPAEAGGVRERGRSV